MKAKLICFMRDFIIKNRDKAKSKYVYMRGFLQNKYDTVWTDSVAEESELSELRITKTEYECWEELFEDFENHQW